MAQSSPGLPCIPTQLCVFCVQMVQKQSVPTMLNLTVLYMSHGIHIVSQNCRGSQCHQNLSIPGTQGHCSSHAKLTLDSHKSLWVPKNLRAKVLNGNTFKTRKNREKKRIETIYEHTASRKKCRTVCILALLTSKGLELILPTSFQGV